MIKKITLFVAVALIAISASAQIKINAGLNLLSPMGDFGDAFKMSYGFNVGGKYMLNDKMAVGANLAYIMLQPETKVSGVTYSLMPIAANFTYYFGTEGFKPYAGIDLGYYTNKVSGGGISISTSDLGFAPTVGFEYGLSDKLGLDVNAKYHYIMTEGDASSAFGINVGIYYNL